MIVRYRLWRRFTRIAIILALPAVLYLILRPEVGSLTKSLQIASLIFSILLGCSGVAVAILVRVGILQFHYADDDRRRLDYPMAKFVAEVEQSQGRSFSHHYYESFGLTPPKQKRSDKDDIA